MNGDERFSPVVEVTRQALQFKVRHIRTVQRLDNHTPMRQPLAHGGGPRWLCGSWRRGSWCRRGAWCALARMPASTPGQNDGDCQRHKHPVPFHAARPVVWPRIARQADRQMVSGPGRGASPGPLTPAPCSLPHEERISRFSRYSRNAGSCPYVTTLALDVDAGGAGGSMIAGPRRPRRALPVNTLRPRGRPYPRVVARTGLEVETTTGPRGRWSPRAIARQEHTRHRPTKER